jgi:hypothetical protein
MRLPLLFAVTALTFSVAGRAAAADDEPPRRYPPSSVRLPLILGGIGLAGGSYAVGFFVSTQWSDVPGSKELRIPVVGPWISLAKTACHPDNPDCGGLLYVRGVLTVLGGLIQAGGLAIAAEGIFIKTESEKPKAARVLEWKSGGVTVRPIPIASTHMNGLGVAGTF